MLCEASTARHDPHLRGLLEDALAAAMNHGEVIEATFAESIAQRAALWRLRESVPEAQRLVDVLLVELERQRRRAAAIRRRVRHAEAGAGAGGG